MLISIQVVDALCSKPTTVAINPDNILRLEPNLLTPSRARTLVHMRGGGFYASIEDQEVILERLRKLDPLQRILVITFHDHVQEIRADDALLKPEFLALDNDVQAKGLEAAQAKYPFVIYQKRPRTKR